MTNILALDNIARLLITCSDKPGIVAAISAFLAKRGANITELDQHTTDPFGGTFFLRLEFHTPNLQKEFEMLREAFALEIAKPFEMEYKLTKASDLKRVAILVSKHDHALLELLWRHNRGELPMELVMVISNHPDLKNATEHFNIPFVHIPVAELGKEKAEERLLETLEGKVDTIILARYMQILSSKVVSSYQNHIINIHHSFLPAFIGADPYQQAYTKGVKLIGATAHFVTEELDEGPIIEQDVKRISHFLSVPQLRELGRTIEREVLSRAIHWYLEDRIILHHNKTIVFS